MSKQSNNGTQPENKRAMTNRDPNKSEVLKSCKATVMTNDFELNILVNNGTTEISVKWGVKIVVFSCYFTVFK